MRFPTIASRIVGGTALFLALSTAVPGSAQTWGIERAGDVIMRAFPPATAGATLALEDYNGSRQFVLGLGITAAVSEGLKRIVTKSRPDGSDEKSFPSGHTSISFHSAAFIHRRYGLRYGVPAYAAAIFVGYSRVHARKHFLTDVATGAAIGSVSALLLTDKRASDPQVPTPLLGLGITVGFGSNRATVVTGGLISR